MERLSDTAIEIINELHTERLDYYSEYIPLIDAANRLAAYEDSGLEPEDLKKAFNETAILKLAAQALSTTPDHLRDLLQAEQDGRLVVLPFMLHSTMLNLSDPENLEVMKDVSLYVAWKSSSGIVFHSPYNCFLQDIEKGYIKADSEEAEAALAKEGDSEK